MIAKLREVAFGKNKDGEFVEPSMRVRAAAAQAIQQFEAARAAAQAQMSRVPAANGAGIVSQTAPAGAAVATFGSLDAALSPSDIQRRYLQERAAELSADRDHEYMVPAIAAQASVPLSGPPVRAVNNLEVAPSPDDFQQRYLQPRGPAARDPPAQTRTIPSSWPISRWAISPSPRRNSPSSGRSSR